MKSPIKEYITQLNTMLAANYKKAGWYYHGMYDFLLREGRIFKSKKLTNKETIAVRDLLDDFFKAYGSPQYKQCYYNAQIALMFDKNDLFKYSEGYAVDKKLGIGLPMMHGFLTINNKVVDITWRNKNGKFYVGELAGEYFGVRFHKEDVTAAICDTHLSQSHIECWWNRGLLFEKKFTDGERYYFTKKQSKFTKKTP